MDDKILIGDNSKFMGKNPRDELRWLKCILGNTDDVAKLRWTLIDDKPIHLERFIKNIRYYLSLMNEDYFKTVDCITIIEAAQELKTRDNVHFFVDHVVDMIFNDEEIKYRW